jgi:hypothetical protein
MSANELQPCPRCSRTDVALVSGRIVYALGDMKKEQPQAKIMVFQCPCGLAYTHEEKVGIKQPNC